MEIRKKSKIKVLDAILQSILNLRGCWKSLLLFTMISIALGISIELLSIRIGFIYFYGGYIVSKVVVGIIRLVFIFVIIKTTSNLMKGEPIHPIKIIKVSFSKLWQVIFQGIICSAVLVPAAVIVLVLMIAITEARTVLTVTIFSILGLLCVKIIFSLHGVLIGNLDGLEGIKESISITKGNYFKLILTITGLWLINYATKSALGLLLINYATKSEIGLLLSRNLIPYIVYNIATAFMMILLFTLLTSMYHQIVPIEALHQPELSKMN